MILLVLKWLKSQEGGGVELAS